MTLADVPDWRRTSRISPGVPTRGREPSMSREVTAASRHVVPNSANPAALPSTTHAMPVLPP